MMINTRARRFNTVVIAAAGALLMSVSPARAQLWLNGGTRDTGVAPVRGTDTGYDPVNHVYLLVGTTAGNTPFPLWGVFVNTSGDVVTGPFQINSGGNAQFPRVRYSPDVNNGAGGFLVAWHGGPLPDVHTRVVAYPNVLVSQEFESGSGASFQESGPATAYSTVSHVFLTVWKSSTNTVWGMLVSTGGAPGAPFQISAPGLGARDPSVAYNPATNQFGVLYSGYGDSNGATDTLALVNTSGTLLTRNTFNVGSTGTYVTDLAFNTSTNRFVAAWFQNGGTMGAEIDGSGTLVAQGLLSTTTGTYDGLTIAFNPASGTFLLAGMGQSYDLLGAELNSRGARTSAETQITSLGAFGSFYPRAATNTGAASWDVAFMHQGGASTIANQVVNTTSTGGGPSGSLSAPPSTGSTSTGSTSTGGCPGTAPFPGAVCVNGGWIPGGTSTTTTTTTTSSGGCPGTAPFPGAVCVNGGWVPGGTSTTTTTTTTSSGCPGTAPFPGAVCVNGGWVPGTSGSTSCPGYPTAPFPGAVCVNGGWVPGGSTTTTTTTTTTSSGCPGTAPFPGAVCVNGGWVPGTTSTSTSCPGYPTPAFPGAVCVNGGWVPGGTISTTTTTDGTCTSPDPFTAIGGGICSNGGWTPKG